MRQQARTLMVIGALCVMCAMNVTACGASSFVAGKSGGLTLHVTLVRPPAQTLLDKDVRDTTAVKRLYDAALALPLVKPGVYHCPNDDGSVYHLTFSGVLGTVRTMDANAGGCPFINFLQVNESHWMDQAFIAVFTKTIDVSSLHPTTP
jgi:hypothetical protein